MRDCAADPAADTKRAALKGRPIEWRRRESNPRPREIRDGFYVRVP